jgi:hypothetical protein
MGCSDPTGGQLTIPELALVDTLYNKDIDSIRIYYDSLCTAQYDSLFNEAIDSIVEERIAEILNLRSNK